MIHIGLDAMGGDFAPLEAIRGAEDFLRENHADICLHLIGDEVAIKNH